MAYIGREPLKGRYALVDDISSSFNSSLTSFSMTAGGSPINAYNPQAMIVSLGGVIQKPSTDFTVSGSTITFTTAPAPGTTFFAYLLGDTLHIGQPSDGAVITASIANKAVTGAKLADTLNISSNTTFSGANTNFTSSNTHFVGNVVFSSSGAHFTGANVFFSNTTHVNFTGANVQGLQTGVDTTASVNWKKSVTFESVSLGTVGSNTGTSTVTLDMANGNFFTMTLANNITITNPISIGNSTVSNVQSGSIFLTQDGTGSRTVTFGQYWRFPSGAAPSLSTAANSQDRIDYVVLSSNTVHASVTLDLLGT